MFLECNSEIDEKGNYRFESIISEVYKAVAKCCQKLNHFTTEVLINQHGYTLDSLLQSKFVHTKEDRKPLLHEERIIHQHIGYIDAYRMHLIVTKRLDCITINKKIIPLIENYMSLLKNNNLYGDVSKELYKDFELCIKYIRDKCNYDNAVDSISRDGATVIRKRNEQNA